MSFEYIISFISGLLLGIAIAVFFYRIRLKELSQMEDKFKSLASDVLEKSQQSFLSLAETKLKQTEISNAAALDKKVTAIDELVKPVKETLTKMDKQLQELEVKRHGAYKELMQAVSISNETQQQLRSETSQLLQALRSPSSRGQWGELQLKRILEMTGMSEYAQDFSSQHSLQTDASSLRPDYIVRLPSERYIIIDSKVPLASYLSGVQSSSEHEKQEALIKHAKAVKEHIKTLSSKSYSEAVEGSADFVVLFIPGDHFLAAALDTDPELMEFSTQRKIILATPMTLIALLRTVALCWRQENLKENAEKLGILGGELYNSLTVMTSHMDSMGSAISSSVEHYNKMIGSYERNVVNKARKLQEFGAANITKNISDTVMIDKSVREIITKD
ncbi:MAG: DNA recombination protein RmuC [Alphaproteobacteria bacterium]|nr:DNA recombination protein RmuC [Alphaproteobacteria bacterium]